MKNYLQRGLIVLLAVLMVVGSLPLSVWAEDVQGVDDEELTEQDAEVETQASSGTCGDNLTWTLDGNGELTISGTGRMDNYNYNLNETPWYFASRAIQRVIVEEGVLSIGTSAFDDCVILKSISLPNSLEGIGDGAFWWCTDLTSITIPGNATSIGNECFGYCYGLNSITIPFSVKEIGENSFLGCDGDLVIYGYHDSYAETYANKKNITFQSLGEINNFNFIITDTETGAPISGAQIKADFYDAPAVETDDQGRATLQVSGEGISSLSVTITKEGYEKFSQLVQKAGDAAIEVKLTKKTVEEPDNQIDFMVARVKDYTSDYANERLNKIMNETNLSGDAKLQKLNAFFVNEEMTDYQEGIQYLRDTFDERQAYKALTTNDLYCAFNFTSEIESNLALRSALYISGLIFNSEYKDWIDPTTYLTMETPGVKKYKAMFMDYLEANKENVEFIHYMEDANTVLKDSTGILSSVEKEQAIAALQNCKDKKEINGIFSTYVGNKSGTIETKSSEFGKALGYAGKVIGFAGNCAEDYELYMDIESNLECYQQYKDFFDEIANSEDFPFEMRVAALQIKAQFENKILTINQKISTHMLGYLDDGISTIYKLDELRVAGTSSGDVSEALLVLDVGTFVSNQFIDLSEFVQKEASVEAYAYLSNHYCNKLESIKHAFSKNQTSENAWAFYECYNTLHGMRIAGEEAYLEMNNVGGIASLLTDYGYTEKYAVVIQTLVPLKEKYGFDLTHTEYPAYNTMYNQKVIASCPVNMEVYDQQGNRLYTIEDGAESDVTNQYGRFVSIYCSFTNDYTKIAYLNDTDHYSVKLLGQEAGLVSASVTKRESDTVSTQAFDYESLNKGGNITFSTDSADKDYRVDAAGDGKDIVQKDLIERKEETVPVTGITLENKTVRLAVNQTKVFGIDIQPANATNKGVQWLSSNPAVATVENGCIKGMADGNATITVTTLDGNYTAIIEVSVGPADFLLGDVNADGQINASDALQDLRHSVKEITLDGDAFTRGNVVSTDDVINASDALQILRYSVKEITEF